MNKLITALNNNEINNKLKNLNKYEIKYGDISYQEGIFEILEKEDIDILLLSEILKGPYNIKELINKIKEINNKIEIILILEKKNEKLEKFLLEKNINNYFYNNQLSINDFNNFNFISKKINNNIEELKKYILKNKYINKNNNKSQNKLVNINNSKKQLLSEKNNDNNFNNNLLNKNNKLKSYFNNNSEKINRLKNNKKYIFSFCGKDSLKKSISILIFSLILKNKKVLNIDLDFLNQNINTLFGVNKFPNKNNLKLNNNILKVNKNIDYMSGLEEIINNNYQEIILKINKLKNNYDYIFINLSSITNMKLTKKILEISDYNICIFNNENNDIIYNNNLLKIYNEEWGIDKNKFICFFNNEKNNKYINENNNIFFDLNLEKYKINNSVKKQYEELLKCVNK